MFPRPSSTSKSASAAEAEPGCVGDDHEHARRESEMKGRDQGRRGRADGTAQHDALAPSWEFAAQLIEARTCADRPNDGVRTAGHRQVSAGPRALGSASDAPLVAAGPEAATRLSATRTKTAAASSHRQISGPWPVEKRARAHLVLSATSVMGPGRSDSRSSGSMGVSTDSDEEVLTARICRMESP